MAAHDERRVTSAKASLARDDSADLLLTATVQELRDHAQRLDEATAEVRRQTDLLAEARQAVAAERRRYRELFELAPDAWLCTNEVGVVIEANAHASELLRVEGDLLVGVPLVGFVEESSATAFAVELDALAASGGRRRTQLRVVPRGGETLDVEATVARVPAGDDGGTLLWLLRDVSERAAEARRLGARLTERTAELAATRERVEQERGRLRDLFQRLQEGIVVVDRKVEVTYANTAAKEIFRPSRLTEGEPLPEPWPGVSVVSLARTLFTKRPQLRDLHVETVAGRVLSVRGIPALDAETAGLVIADISARERRDRAEREFVANAAHELRTPLSAITGAIEVLQRGAKDEPAERDRFLGHIEREAARLGRLTTALLVLARAQMGMESPRLEVVPVRPLLDEAAAEMHAAREVRVDVRCARELAVFANRSLVEQALGNLASNAAKHTHRGSISLRCSRENERWVALEIHDTGSGMQPEENLRAEERFYRAGAQPGFGLGLAIASEAVRALGGRLELQSDEGRGTTARIVLPSAEVVLDG